MTDQEKKDKLKALVKSIHDDLNEAEALADETGESFGIDPAYGMGGHYHPDETNEYTGNNWFPSSLSC